MQEAWKAALARGRQIRYKVGRQDKGTGLTAGALVPVRHAPIDQIAAGDTVLCQVGNTVRLRKVSRIVSVYGVPTIEVFIGDKSVVSRYVQESACFGKVCADQETPPLPWWQALLRRPEVVLE